MEQHRKTQQEKCTKTASMGPEMSCHHGESRKQARENLALVETMAEKINEKFANLLRSTNKTDLFNSLILSQERRQFSLI